MKTGVVLLNYNNKSDLLRLINKLLYNDDIFIVVPDNSKERDKELYELEIKYNKNIKYIFNNDNLGYYKGNLIGVKYLYNNNSIDKVLILNPDVGASNWGEIIEKLLLNFDHENVFMVGPKVRIPNYKDLSSPKPVFCFYKEIFYNFLFPLSYIFLRKKQTKLAKKSGKVFAVEGSAYLVDARKYIEIEDYFNNIFLYGEEILFGLISEIKGWEIKFDNSVEVLHFHEPRKESKTFDKYYLESIMEIAKIMKKNELTKLMIGLSIKYKKNIKKILLKVKK